MGNGVRKYCAALLVLWYCISVIGFDVHTCKGDGRSFLATAVSGMNCSDIHPGHECAAEHSHCCHDCCADDGLVCEGSENLSSDCCTDDYQVLVLTGVPQDDSHRHYDECHCGHCPCAGMASLCTDVQCPQMTVCIASPGSGGAESVPRPASVRFGVWRI